MTTEDQQVEQGARLDQLIKTLKLNSKTFAAAISVSQGFVSQMSNGKRPITHRVLNKITGRYEHVNTHWLMTGDGEMFIRQKPLPNEPELSFVVEAHSGSKSKTFSRNFFTIRKRWGFSQEAFADLLGITRFVVGNIERGRNAPDYDTVAALETLTGFTHHDLRTRELSLSEVPASPKSEIPKLADPIEDMRQRLIRIEMLLRELLSKTN